MFRKLICLVRRFKLWIRLKITHSSFTLDDFKKLVESTKKMEDISRLDLSYNDYLKQYFNHTVTLIGDSNASKPE